MAAWTSSSWLICSTSCCLVLKARSPASSNSRNSCSTLRWSALIRATASCAITISSLVDEQLVSHAAKGAAQQPRDVHLGAPDPGGDVVLVQVVEEPQDHDLALRLGQAVDQAGQQEEVLRLLAGRGGREAVAKGGVALLADLLVERHLRAGVDDLDRLEGVLFGDPEVVGQLGHGRGAPQGVGQLVQGLAQAQGALLDRPGDVDPPAGV